MRAPLRDVLTGILALCMGGCTSGTGGALATDGGGGEGGSGADGSVDGGGEGACETRTIATKSSIVQLTEAQVCELLGPRPSYAVPSGPHSVVDGECVKLCGDAAINYCQLPYAQFQAYSEPAYRSDAGTCPSGFLNGATAPLTCEVQVANPKYTPKTACPEAVGRPPAGFLPSFRSPTCLGEHLANAAETEAASVVGFLAIREALERWGAPADLVAGASRAAGEEAGHARAMEELARAHGGAPRSVDLVPTTFASHEELALENAREGLVRETFAALVAMHRARSGADPVVRRVLEAIAEEEAGHAELSRALDAWLRTQLDDVACARVDAARRAASCELVEEVEGMRFDRFDALGGPSIAEARTMLTELDRVVWSA